MTHPLVLCYHGVSEQWEAPLAVRPTEFERQLRSLLRRGFRPVGAAEAVSGRGRTFHVTFDDAFTNVAANAVPILERLGIPATIFAASGFARAGRPLDVPELVAEAAAQPGMLQTMDWSQLRELAERGFEIGSHTVNHPHLTELSDAELDREMRDSRASCEEELGRPCPFLAYPYGEHDGRVRAAARRAGYRAAFALHDDGGHDDLYALPRAHFYRRDTLARVTLKTSFARRPVYALARMARPASAAGAGAVSDDGWLGAIVPAQARTFRVADPALASVLDGAGAQLVDGPADVEIAAAQELRGDAPLAVVAISARPHDSGSFAVRAGKRLANSGQTRIASQRARRALRRLGYPFVETIAWDFAQPFRREAAGGRALVEYVPQRALVVGRRGPATATLAGAALADAARPAGAQLTGATSSVRTGGVLVTLTDTAVLRLAVGPGRSQIEAQAAALDALRAATDDDRVIGRIPWPATMGRSGLATWSLEPRLPGSRPDARLGGGLLAGCVDFLVALHAAGPAEPARSMRDRAEDVAEHRPDARDALQALADRVDDALAGVPFGFGHGDFFCGNLLASGDRLTGVLDWDAAGPGRPPLIDLLHLRHEAAYPVPDHEWGASVVRRLLPWARSGGDDMARTYCRRVGFEPDPATLEALVLSYWLDRLDYQLRTHAHRSRHTEWLAGNIDDVLATSPLASGLGRSVAR